MRRLLWTRGWLRTLLRFEFVCICCVFGVGFGVYIHDK